MNVHVPCKFGFGLRKLCFGLQAVKMSDAAAKAAPQVAIRRLGILSCLLGSSMGESD